MIYHSFFKVETSQASNTTFSLDPFFKKMIGTCQKLQLGTLKRYFRNNAEHNEDWVDCDHARFVSRQKYQSTNCHM